MKTIRQIKSALIQILYWAIRVAAFPLLVFYFVYRCARDPRYLPPLFRALGRRARVLSPDAARAPFGCTPFPWAK